MAQLEHATRAPASAAFKIQVVDPMAYKTELIDLFTRHGVAHYPRFLETAYPAAATLGSKHWVGFDANQRVVMHMGRFTHRFKLGDREVRAGLLVNLMVHQDHRDFFPVMSLMRRVVADSRTDGAVDFLYTNPNEGGAAVIKGGGLKPIATLRRLALPLGGRSWASRWGAYLYSRGCRFRARGPALEMREEDAVELDRGRFEQPTNNDCVSPVHPEEWYTIWPPGPLLPPDRWFTFRDHGRPVGAVQVRGPEPDGAYRLLTVRRFAGGSLASLLWPVCDVIGKAGARNLSVWTLEESSFAAELRSLGFLLRADSQPFFTMALTDAGRTAIAALPNWEITDFDCDR